VQDRAGLAREGLADQKAIPLFINLGEVTPLMKPLMKTLLSYVEGLTTLGHLLGEVERYPRLQVKG
jgi:hypothetical protein